MLRNASFQVLALSAGAMQGVFNVWSGSLDSILPFTPMQCGWLGFGSTAALVVGGYAIGGVVDKWSWASRRLKAVLLLVLCGCLASFSWFTLSLPFFSHPALLHGTLPSQATAIVCSGLLLGAISPVVYEFSVELTYPVSEAVSASFVASYNNVGSMAFLLAKGVVRQSSLNLAMTAAVALTVLCVAMVRERYNRPSATPRTPAKALKAGHAAALQAVTAEHTR